MLINLPKKYVPTEEKNVIIRRIEDEVAIEETDGSIIGYLPNKIFRDKFNNMLFARRDFFRAIIDPKGTLRVIRYTPLHAHSGYSMLDGASKIKDMADKAEYALALTDHGNMFGAFDFHSQMNEVGKKPILGYEAYSETIDGEKVGNHLLLIAENDKGFQNLVKLVSKSNENKKGKYNYVSYDMLEEYSEGIIASSACLGGEVSQAIIHGKDEEALRVTKEMQRIFGHDNYFIEIQRHGLPEEKIVNPILIEIANEIGAKIIATSDSHYTDEDGREGQDVLMCLSTNDTLDNPDRFKLTGTGYHIHSSEEMIELFHDMPEVLDNTLEISERCNVSLGSDEKHMPHFDIPEEYETEDEYFEALCWNGFENRFKGTDAFDSEEYKERLEYEMGVITDMGFPGYFIITWDIINYANNNDILVGPGRGSACGSLVAYVLEITDVNPIPYGLLFERFLNPDRYSMPDIDTDFPNTRREEIIEYTRKKYGEASVARIVTYSTLTAKRVVRDVTKVMGYPFSAGSKIADTIPDRPGMDLDGAFEESAEFNKIYDEDEDAKEIIDMALQLEGLPRNTSMHACFTGDTLVTTKEGLTKISDINEGTEVMTHKNRFKPAVSTMTTVTESVYNIKATNVLPIETTFNHPFLVKEMTRKTEKNDKKVQSVKTYSEPMWKEASDLEVGKDYLGIPINKEAIIPEMTEYNLPFENESFWWLMGRYIGDGWTECHNRKQNDGIRDRQEKRIIICCTNKTEDERNEIERNLELAGIDYRVELVKTTYKIHLYEEDLYEYLQTFGRYAHGKHLNADIINLPIDLAESFLDGYMSADGSYQGKFDRYTFKTVSKALAVGVLQLVNKVYKRPVQVQILPAKEEAIEGRKVQSKEKYNLSFTKDTRKKERSYYDEVDGYIWTRIRDISIQKREETMYNLTVVDDSSYVVHGVAVHNCGVIISAAPVNDYVPTYYAKNTDTGTYQLTTQFDKDQVEDMGLLKMDFLGLKTLGVIDESIQLANKRREDVGECPLTMRTIPVDDTETYQNIQKGNTSGIFQLEGPGMTSTIGKILEGIQEEENEKSHESLLKLIAVLSLYRPGPMDEIPNYLAGMKNPEGVEYENDSMKTVLSETHGVIVYQEQVMQLVRDLAGFSRGQSDILRKGMGKKIPEIMNDWGDAFIYGSKELNVKGCVPNGISESLAKNIWEKMVRFSDYAFNKSHAAGYSFLSARTGWLATHYPVEFYTSMMNVFIGEKEKAQKYLATSKKEGIKILQPSVNHSQEKFSVDGNNIRFGLNGISHVGKTANEIIAERESNGKFVDMRDFVVRMVKNYRLTTRALSHLILVGGLDEFPGSRLEKSKASDDFLELGKFIRDAQDNNRPTLFDITGVIEQPLFNPKLNNKEELDKELLLSKERELAGFYISGHPLKEYTQIMKEKKDNYQQLSTLTDSIQEKIEKENKDTFNLRGNEGIAGVVTGEKTFYTKKGDPLKILEVEDETGSIECIVFASTLQANRGLFNEGDLLFLEGNIKVEGGEITFVTQTAEDLHVFKRSSYPEAFKIVGNKDKKEALKQYKKLIKWATNSKKQKNGLNRIPLVFVQGEDEHDMGVSIPYSNDNITKVREIVGSSSLKVAYDR